MFPFQLQISRSQTIIAPVQMDSNDPADRMSQLKRYAATHNPQSTGKATSEKLRPIKNRHVSIPGIRAESPDDERDQLYISGMLGPKDKPLFSSGSTWRDRNDLDKLAPRKIAAAGIVKMYIGNHELIGNTMKNPLYTTISDGRGHSDSLTDSDTLIVQPLLKRTKRGSSDSTSLELPNIAIGQTASKQTNAHLFTESEEIDTSLTDAPGTDSMMHTRVS